MKKTNIKCFFCLEDKMNHPIISARKNFFYCYCENCKIMAYVRNLYVQKFVEKLRLIQEFNDGHVDKQMLEKFQNNHKIFLLAKYSCPVCSTKDASIVKKCQQKTKRNGSRSACFHCLACNTTIMINPAFLYVFNL